MPPELTEALYQLALLLITVCGLLITIYVLPWLKQVAGEQRLKNARIAAGQAVGAVEQMSGASDSPSMRLDAALDRARALGKAHGVTLTDAQWKTLIETAVLQLKQIDAVVAGEPAKGKALPERDEHGRFIKKQPMGFHSGT